jgi:hypothetical protein
MGGKGGSGWALLTLCPSPGKIASTMQLGNAVWTGYAYFTWSRPTPSLSG